MAEKEVKTNMVPFDEQQMQIIQQMIVEAKGSRSSEVTSVSMYNQRDPKSIETVNVRRIDGHFVVGWKNVQKDSFKKKPLYLQYKPIHDKGAKEPFITLILSDDGINLTEKEMPLVDYMTEQDRYKAKVLKVDIKKVIEDHGYLGSTGEYATAVDSRGLPESRPTILAQTEHEVRVFTVELPGFEKPWEFIAEFLG